MLFNSLHFLIFYPVVTVIYFMLPFKLRWVLLLISSYYFYMCWRVDYVFLIFFCTLITYYSALKMGELSDKNKKKKYLIISSVINIGILFIYKYFDFFNESLSYTLDNFGISYSLSSLNLLLPVGISFYTFQALGYTIDVYQGVKKPEKHFGIYALYVSFFPQLVAGPIERSTSLIPQFFNEYKFEYNRITSGLRLILLGFFKKVVVADKLAIVVNHIYQTPQNYEGVPLIIATLFFSFQIYCDFSGYTDIARGSARVLGFDLVLNFKQPYFSKSIAEFWRRWHM